MKFDAETYKIRAWSKQGPFYFQCVLLLNDDNRRVLLSTFSLKKGQQKSRSLHSKQLSRKKAQRVRIGIYEAGGGGGGKKCESSCRGYVREVASTQMLGGQNSKKNDRFALRALMTLLVKHQSRSRTLEGLFELTQSPSRAFDLVFYIPSRITER